VATEALHKLNKAVFALHSYHICDSLTPDKLLFIIEDVFSGVGLLVSQCLQSYLCLVFSPTAPCLQDWFTFQVLEEVEMRAVFSKSH